MKTKKTQIWLFAFTDLAFLLLISLSLVPSAPDNINIHFSEMDIPAVPENPNLSPVKGAYDVWELQVYEQTEDHPKPFGLVKVGIYKSRATEQYSKNLDRNDLIPELESLKQFSARPTLMPEKKSLSQDFLFAAGALARVWSSANTQTIVKPMNPEELSQK
jgi:hypothetical protein